MNIPGLLLASMDHDAMSAFELRLRRTRRRHIVFGMNGVSVPLPRARALEMVREMILSNALMREIQAQAA